MKQDLLKHLSARWRTASPRDAGEGDARHGRADPGGQGHGCLGLQRRTAPAEHRDRRSEPGGAKYSLPMARSLKARSTSAD